MKISIIGSGNIATFFAHKFRQAGMDIVQIISAHLQHAKVLADYFNASYSDTIKDLQPDADIYLFAVSDDVLLEFARHLQLPHQLVVHTAGSVHLKELSRMSPHVACIWPVYSISKKHLPDSTHIPLVINATDEHSLSKVQKLAGAVSDQHFNLNDEQKSVLHLAAVFANNFTNHMYAISHKIVEQHQIPFETLLPLISDTASKIQNADPSLIQTGPAIRHDEKTMQKHLTLLKDENFRQLYQILSESIQNS